MELSCGCVAAILSGGHDAQSVSCKWPSLLLQVISAKRIESGPGCSSMMLVLSDSKHYVTAVFTGQGAPIALNTVVELVQWSLANDGAKPFLDVKRLNVVVTAASIVGEPTQWQSEPQGPPSAPLPLTGRCEANSTHLAHGRSDALSESHARSGGAGVQPNGPKVLISQLGPYSRTWCLRARVTARSSVRTFRNARGDGIMFTAEVMDAEGAQVRVTSFGTAVQKFYEIMAPNRLVDISGGMVRQGNPRYTPHPLEITLSERTSKVCVAEDDGSFRNAPYHFVALAQLEQISPGTLVDVAGVVTEAKDMAPIRTSRGEVRGRRVLTIADDSKRSCRFTLWGAQADEQSELRAGQVVFIRYAKVSQFGGGRSLDSAELSSIDVDPDNARAFELRRWFEKEAQTIAPLAQTDIASQRPLYLLAEVRAENAALHTSPWAAFVYQVAPVTVLDIPHERPVFYMACTAEVESREGGMRTCHRKVERLGVSWQCAHGHVCSEPHARYILRVELRDATCGRFYATAFDDEARLLLGCPAADVATLDDRRQLGTDPDAGKAFEAIFSRAMYTRWSVKMRCRLEEYNGRQRVHATLSEISPLKASDARRKLEAVFSACQIEAISAGGG
eukprot:TRINITY_DN14867_c0_g3_i1.p1 TRINITY_DN14867_c0_g3~~TRINITY_DN14867_c0_g3_i1.p1  ORF type:complete len:619 (+),score=83.68 TRINITY_DN14867_c0_g3_i1:96-1952(+)